MEEIEAPERFIGPSASESDESEEEEESAGGEA